MGIPKLECVVDELAVLTQGTNHGMIAQEWQHFLLGCLALDERSDGPEVKGPVTEGDLAGLLDRPRWNGGRQGSRGPGALATPSTPRASIIASAQAVLCGPSRIATLPKSHAAPRSTPLIFSAAMYSGGVLKRPGSCLACTAICCIRSLKIRTMRPSHRTQTSRARYSGGTA